MPSEPTKGFREDCQEILAYQIHDTSYRSLKGQDKLSVDQAISAIQSLVLDLIGPDEKFKCGAGLLCDNDMCCDGQTGDVEARNNLRQALRERVKE